MSNVASSVALVLSFSISWVSIAPATAATAVDTCGQSFEGNGYLVGDLDCSGYDQSFAVGVKAPSGRLDLRGFTITSDKVPTVACGGNCMVTNGTLAQGEFVFDTYGEGVYAVVANGSVVVRDVVIAGRGPTPGAGSRWHYGGITAQRGKIERVTMTGGDRCLSGFERVRVKDFTCKDGYAGILKARVAQVATSEITGNFGAGIWVHQRLSLASSVVRGAPGADIVAPPDAQLRLRASECDTSFADTAEETPASLGICALD